MKCQIQFAKKMNHGLEKWIAEQLAVKLHAVSLEIPYVKSNRPWKMYFQDIIFHEINVMKIVICSFQNIRLLVHLTEGEGWSAKKRALKGLVVFP